MNLFKKHLNTPRQKPATTPEHKSGHSRRDVALSEPIIEGEHNGKRNVKDYFARDVG